MQINEQRKGAVTVLVPNGPLVQEDADIFRDRAIHAFAKSLGRCIVDASKIPFVDSRGLEALVAINDQLAQSGHALKLCQTNKTVREVLDLTELGSLFEQYDDVNTAVRSFL